MHMSYYYMVILTTVLHYYIICGLHLFTRYNVSCYLDVTFDYIIGIDTSVKTSDKLCVPDVHKT